MEKLQFDNLAGGAVQERFNDVLQDVLDNIIDPNTDPKKQRKVTLTLTFKPGEERDFAAVEFSVVPGLAPRKSITAGIMIDRTREGKAVAAEVKRSVPGQTRIDEFIPAENPGAPSNVVSMQK